MATNISNPGAGNGNGDDGNGNGEDPNPSPVEPFDPFGQNPPDPGAPVGGGSTKPKNIYCFYQGDHISFTTVAMFQGEPATVDNSQITFYFQDDRFFEQTDALFVGTWGDGIEAVNSMGGIEVSIPDELSATLRRGAFLYSLSVTDNLGDNNRLTFEEGSIHIEYAANAPLPDIPYKTSSEDEDNQN